MIPIEINIQPYPPTLMVDIIMMEDLQGMVEAGQAKDLLDLQMMEEADQAEDLLDLQEEEEEGEDLTVETLPPLDKGGEGSTEM